MKKLNILWIFPVFILFGLLFFIICIKRKTSLTIVTLDFLKHELPTDSKVANNNLELVWFIQNVDHEILAKNKRFMWRVYVFKYKLCMEPIMSE